MDAIETVETVAAAAEEASIAGDVKEIAKTLSLSAAQTAGAVLGVAAVYVTYTKVQAFRQKRRNQVVAAAENILTETTENENTEK